MSDMQVRATMVMKNYITVGHHEREPGFHGWFLEVGQCHRSGYHAEHVARKEQGMWLDFLAPIMTDFAQAEIDNALSYPIPSPISPTRLTEIHLLYLGARPLLDEITFREKESHDQRLRRERDISRYTRELVDAYPELRRHIDHIEGLLRDAGQDGMTDVARDAYRRGMKDGVDEMIEVYELWNSRSLYGLRREFYGLEDCTHKPSFRDIYRWLKAGTIRRRSEKSVNEGEW